MVLIHQAEKIVDGKVSEIRQQFSIGNYELIVNGNYTPTLEHITILNSEIKDLNSVIIERAIWGTESGVYQPIETIPLQSFLIGTQSSYRTEISTSVMRDYLITTELRNDYGGTNSWYKLNNKVSISKNNYLGQIIETEV